MYFNRLSVIGIFTIFLIGSLVFNPFLNPNVPNAFAQSGIVSDIRVNLLHNFKIFCKLIQ